MPLNRTLLLAAALLAPTALHAQFAVGATLTGQTLVFDPNLVPSSLDAGSHGLAGTTLSAQADFGRLIRGGVDIRSVITRSGAIGVNSFAFGPRIVLAPRRLPVRPYLEGLLGGAYVRSDSSPKFTGRYADYTVVIGVDLGITSHIDWRVFEYSHSTVSGEDIRNQFSTGIVYRFYKLPSFSHARA